MKLPKIALFYDWLNQWGGAEKVLLDILKIYPQADLYTLVYDPLKANWLPAHQKISTTFINRLPFSQNNPIFYTPLYALALEQINFSDYDIVISNSTTIGHCLLTLPQTMFVCYFHNINRHLYQSQSTLFNHLIKFYYPIDQIYSKRPDFYLAGSITAQKRIENIYHRPSTVIYPAIDTDYFIPIAKPSLRYFLLSSRLVPHKKVDLAIKAFSRLPYELKIVGVGRESDRLHQLAAGNKNIEFLGLVSQEKLLSLYQNCQALIYPQLEDFGLTALEAQACGRPVIAFGQGGVTETVINHQTGLFFNQQTPDSLIQSINNFFSKSFSPETCRHNALKFSQNSFMLHLKQTIDTLWQDYQRRNQI